jgi:hypothetical protein
LRDRAESREDKGSTALSDQDKLLKLATTNLRDGKSNDRKRKRLPGEDDTDRDLRYAKERADGNHGADKAVVRMRPSNAEDAQAPLTDRKGNINLFPETKVDKAKKARHSEKDKEKERQKDSEENYGMHLKDVWGRKDGKEAWYMDKNGAVKDSEGRDVWGNEDPRRRVRQAHRVSTSDPLAFMKQAQRQLKEVQREREERDAELEELRSRHGRGRDDEELEDFHLDQPPSDDKRRHKCDHRHRRQERSRSLEHKKRHSHVHSRRSRSPEREVRAAKYRHRSRHHSTERLV